MLETAPSFDIYSKTPNDVDAQEEQDKSLEGSGDFSFVKSNMGLIKEHENDDDGDDEDENGDGDQVVVVDPVSHSMYLATGLGITDDGTGGECDFGDLNEISQELCGELLQQYPNHPLLLRRFAQLLQGNGDLQAAEEYLFRAAQADPGDGDTLIQYAQLVWELHHDPERALTYFELAKNAAPENSYVLAAFAKFLWETENESDDTSKNPEQEKSLDLRHAGGTDVDSDVLADSSTALPVDMGGLVDGADIENHYQQMIEKNPSNPFFLKKYAQLLYQSKGDLQGAEEYYSRAVLADPRDGEILSQFATLLWELHHDQDKTLNYLERAIEAAPQDSNVLAAYARILWAIDDE